MSQSDFGENNEERLIAARRRLALKKWAVEKMGGKCSLCPYDRCFRAFDFHHLDPSQKDFNISDGLQMSLPKLWDELCKCMLVCSNCHREIHDGFHPSILIPGEDTYDPGDWLPE